MMSSGSLGTAEPLAGICGTLLFASMLTTAGSTARATEAKDADSLSGSDLSDPGFCAPTFPTASNTAARATNAALKPNDSNQLTRYNCIVYAPVHCESRKKAG